MVELYHVNDELIVVRLASRGVCWCLLRVHSTEAERGAEDTCAVLNTVERVCQPPAVQASCRDKSETL